MEDGVMTTETRPQEEQDVERTVAARSGLIQPCLLIHLGHDESHDLRGEVIPMRTCHPERVTIAETKRARISPLGPARL